MPDALPQTWRERAALAPGVLEALLARTAAARLTAPVYPPEGSLFRALELTPPERVRAVILGQDPITGRGQAMGLAFSVPAGVPLPPSLRNIFRELEDDTGVQPPRSGDLTAWAERGVLLLNPVLTVEGGKANSHADWGWQAVTDAILAALSALPQPIACVLWGAHAQKKAPLLQSGAPRLLLRAPHPSPLSSYRGFFGSRPFSQINAFLTAHGEPPIDWAL